MTWREYHQQTKHTAEALRRSRHYLDWETMPDPFRHYEGAPVLDLPADPPSAEIPALDLLLGAYGATQATDGAAFLSQLLFYSAAISATKRVPSSGYQYALRVNPSSGNLHPTEFHFRTRGLQEWPDGFYHYRPSSHMAEQRAVGDLDLKPTDGAAPIVFVLTSIAWREAWKYRDRAYRYCLHDMGHAWQSLALAARAMGCDSFAYGCFPDDEIAQSCRLSEDEWPMLLIEIRGAPTARQAGSSDAVWRGGEPNRLSTCQVPYPLIDAMHGATKLEGSDVRLPELLRQAGHGEIPLPMPATSARPFGQVVRTRRSALDFRGGMESITFAQLSAMLSATAQPLAADFAGGRFIQLYLYAHRVNGLEPGVYRYWPESAQLELVRAGDQRLEAAGLSLGQALAGNACVAFSMIADIDRAARVYGDRGYRYAYFEAGATGQRLYVAAEALGLRATGIGAFYDDEVHRYLGIAPEQGQVVYHFAIGYPVHDPRLEA
jgi:SagB-type dehydrogenase family enzyme